MTQKQSRTPRKKPAAKNAKRPQFARQMLWLALKVGLVLLLTLFIYLIYLDSKITTLFSSHKWQFPAQVYARSLELIPGKSLTQKQLISELDLLQYRAVNKINGPGQYSQSGDKVTVFRRAFQFADGQGLGHKAAAALAGQHLLAQGGDVPTLPGFIGKCLQQRLMVGAAGEVLPLVRVAAQVIE